VEFLRADMGDAAEVLPARGRGARAERSIDVLIHSAGGMPPSGRREVLDRGFTQNLLGAFLLTRPPRGAPPREGAVRSALREFQ
jgi:NAD(P)-dependent dehydrogenase (short-subunit alcohol dehydrogenase family)